MSLEPGKAVGKSLRLVRLLGRGAMGTVWLADHAGLQAQVAVKFMSPAMLEDPVSVARFKQEAKAAAKIRSPHVVQVFDHGQTDEGEPFIVMELLEGESLERRCKTHGPMKPTAAAAVVAQAAKALAKAHECGVIHRDIKPSNLFLIDEGGGGVFVKVLDFGVAKFAGEEAVNMTAVGNMVGTPAYMSPQQLFHGHKVDYRSDLWSLAVVAYYALIGTRPFEGKTLGELCVSIKRGEFTRPSKLRNDLGPDIDAWFARALHQDPSARFATAKEMALELERAAGVPTIMESTPSLVASSPAVATYPGTSLPVDASSPALVRERRPMFLLAAALCVVLVAVAGAAFVFGRAGGAEASAERGEAVVVVEAAAPVETVATTEPVAPPAAPTEVAPPAPTSAEPPTAPSEAPPPVVGGPQPWPQPPSTTRSDRARDELGI